VAVTPKTKCCLSKPRCKRCPVRLLSDGKLNPDQVRRLFSDGRNKKALKKAKIKVS